MFKVPYTQEEAVAIYKKRRKQKRSYLKYDMLLGGMACCNIEEFERDYGPPLQSISCNYCRYGNCNCISCEVAAHEILQLKWNEAI